MNFESAYLKSAGAYVSIDGFYPFVIERKLHNGNIPVVQLGGHANPGETGWECAQREAFEEASIHIRPVKTEKTFWVQAETTGLVLQEVRWDSEIDPATRPCLVVTKSFEVDPSLSLMYLAQSGETPLPSNEVKGILLLDPDSIQEICQTSVTLDEYLKRGGRAILRQPFDQGRRLEPFIQLLILAEMMKTHKI